MKIKRPQTYEEIRREIEILKSRYEITNDVLIQKDQCTSGLFMVAIGKINFFPLSARELKNFNKNLTFKEAKEFAIKIIHSNQRKHFPQAFKHLYSALRFAKKEN